MEVIAVVCGFLIAHPLGLGFGALVMFGGVVESAITAGMKVGPAAGALIAGADPLTRLDFEGLAALPAVHKKARE